MRVRGLGAKDVVLKWDWRMIVPGWQWLWPDLYDEVLVREKIQTPPSYTVPPAPSQPERWREWTPEAMYEAMRQRREQYGKDVASPPVSPAIPVQTTGSAEKPSCSWYQRWDEEAGECVFGSGALWIVSGAGLLLVLMAATVGMGVGAGARTAGRVIEKRYLE